MLATILSFSGTLAGYCDAGPVANAHLPMMRSRHEKDEFWEELMILVAQISANPLEFHLVDRGLLRANMPRFPYHILFRQRTDGVRVMVLRHNKRRPDLGLTRT